MTTNDDAKETHISMLIVTSFTLFGGVAKFRSAMLLIGTLNVGHGTLTIPRQRITQATPNQVIRDKSGKVDLFGTILARKNTTDPLPILEPTSTTTTSVSTTATKDQNCSESTASGKQDNETSTVGKPFSNEGTRSEAFQTSPPKKRAVKSPSPENDRTTPVVRSSSEASKKQRSMPSDQSVSPPRHSIEPEGRFDPPMSNSFEPIVRLRNIDTIGTICAIPPNPNAGGRWKTCSTVGSAEDLERFCEARGLGPGQKTIPFRGRPTDALHVYCQNPDKIEPEFMYYYDEHVVVINDAYAKSRYHYLVMPRKPINYLANLRGVEGIQTVKELYGRALWLMDRLKADYPSYEYKCGFHVIQSMSQVHLHVLSTDYSTARMRRKEHWNSFTTECFLSPQLVLQVLQERGAFRLTYDEIEKFRSILKRNIYCPTCMAKARTMPEIKEHYFQQHWQPRHLELQAALHTGTKG